MGEATPDQCYPQRMRNVLAAIVVSFLACATAEGAAAGFDPDFPATDFLDGGVCLPGEPSTPCADLTPPSVDHKVLSNGLMPMGHPGGLVKVKCRITAAGVIRNCVSLQDEAGLAPAVIQRLHLMQGTAATFKGKPISIDYVVNIRFTP